LPKNVLARESSFLGCLRNRQGWSKFSFVQQ
jgi:hypothetical protein